MAGMTPGARRSARVSSLDGKEKSMRKRLVAATAMLLSTTAGAAGTQEKPAPMHFYDGNSSSPCAKPSRTSIEGVAWALSWR